MPENRGQGIGLNGTVNNEIVGVFILGRATLNLNLPLYTIVPLPILYGVWHTKGGSGGVVCCAIYVQYYCNRVGNAGGRMINSCTKASN